MKNLFELINRRVLTLIDSDEKDFRRAQNEMIINHQLNHYEVQLKQILIEPMHDAKKLKLELIEFLIQGVF